MEGTVPPGEGEGQIPEPSPPPPPPKPEPTLRTVTCGSCQTRFDFPVEANVQSFKFNCTNCGALNEVSL